MTLLSMNPAVNCISGANDLLQSIQAPTAASAGTTVVVCRSVTPMGDCYRVEDRDIYFGDDCAGRLFKATLISSRYDAYIGEQYGDEIEVEEGECQKGHEHESLYFGNISSNIAIGIYDPQSKTGHMYAVGPVDQEEDIEAMLSEIRSDYQEVTHLQILAIGAAMSSDFIIDSVIEMQRAIVEDALAAHFKGAVIRDKWLSPNQFADLHLDLASGKFMIEEKQ